MKSLPGPSYDASARVGLRGRLLRAPNAAMIARLPLSMASSIVAPVALAEISGMVTTNPDSAFAICSVYFSSMSTV